jgi:hypothetical protein
MKIATDPAGAYGACRPEAAELAQLYALATPHYAAVIESYRKAQDVARQSKP